VEVFISQAIVLLLTKEVFPVELESKVPLESSTQRQRKDKKLPYSHPRLSYLSDVPSPLIHRISIHFDKNVKFYRILIR
jgi:hypothetical protein